MSAVASPVTTALAVADRVAVACFRMLQYVLVRYAQQSYPKKSNLVSKSCSLDFLDVH